MQATFVYYNSNEMHEQMKCMASKAITASTQKGDFFRTRALNNEGKETEDE